MRRAAFATAIVAFVTPSNFQPIFCANIIARAPAHELELRCNLTTRVRTTTSSTTRTVFVQNYVGFHDLMMSKR